MFYEDYLNLFCLPSEHSPGMITARARNISVNKWPCRDIIVTLEIKNLEDYK